MAQRKLLQEVDKVFKKINEGLDIFNALHDRHDGANPAQREKLENELKKEVKKLQKSREQIKVWQSTSDIKDKASLLDYRRRVEIAMEKYKVIEKGSKIKAYSNMNLKNQPDVDPSEKEKLECEEFLRETIDSLESQYQVVDVELEKLSSKKSKKSNNGNKEALKELQSKYRWHQQQLELALRLLSNNDLEVEAINEIKEDLTYFLENNRDDNFIENEYLYEGLNLDANDIIQQEITQSFVNEPQTPVEPPASASSAKSEKEKSVSNTPVKSKHEPASIVSPIPKKSSPTTIQITNSSKKPIPLNSLHTPVITSINNQVISTTLPPSALNLTNTLKPAEPPAQSVNEMAWSTLLAPKEERPQLETAAAEAKVAEEAKAIADAKAAEELKSAAASQASAQLSKSVTPSPSTPTSTVSPSSSTDMGKSTSNESRLKAQRTVTPLTSADLSKDDHSAVNSPVNLEEYQQDKDIINLPPGIQDVLCSLYSARTSLKPETNQLDCASKIMNIPRFYQSPSQIITNVTSIDLNRYYQVWNLFRFKLQGIANDKPDLLSSLDYQTLFFGYYYSYSYYEKSLAASELMRRGWLLNADEDTWFLQADIPPESRRDPNVTTIGTIQGNFKSFNPRDFRFVDYINHTLRYSAF
ncbi:hypothetical protein WICPIJ_001628 [Wickerhamomyces pijperi]|uniref:General negative regulator of transcription subunit n=1 Tax=Wickerhamomyces pijperi TaxID=599730 RepID=A0A9P8TQX5_WICPI|nr:hypothetical protein WICPIJ_001628 [Wickerhamomyces pijperi]